mmetsp:Transcript_1448/g.3224  ORF Transcript_1448/g.3224 Transcript_1448/m.3224 type:complete len:105 (+) Transcript_1448:458-772(+)
MTAGRRGQEKAGRRQVERNPFATSDPTQHERDIDTQQASKQQEQASNVCAKREMRGSTHRAGELLDFWIRGSIHRRQIEEPGSGEGSSKPSRQRLEVLVSRERL